MTCNLWVAVHGAPWDRTRWGLDLTGEEPPRRDSDSLLSVVAAASRWWCWHRKVVNLEPDQNQPNPNCGERKRQSNGSKLDLHVVFPRLLGRPFPCMHRSMRQDKLLRTREHALTKFGRSERRYNGFLLR